MVASGAASQHRRNNLDRSASSRGLDRSTSSRGGLGASAQGLDRSNRSTGSRTRHNDKGSNNFQDSLLSFDERDENGSVGSNPQDARTTTNGTKNRQRPKDDSFQVNDVSGVTNRSPSWMPFWLKPIDQARRRMGRFINCDEFQYFILTLIMINAIMMGVATFPFVKSDPTRSYVFDTIDTVFLIIFTIESGLQLIYHGVYLFKDGFLVFDMLIVILSWALEGTQVIRAFRIFRALRLVTRVETMRNLVSAMFEVMPKLGAIMLLLLLVFYIFGVMFTQLYKDLSKEGHDPMGYFSSLPNTLFTLFQIMCLDEWAAVYEVVAVFYWWSWLPFIAFIVITAFVVINLVVAVICDVVADLDDKNQKGLHGIDSSDECEKKDDRDDENKPSLEQRLKELQDQIDSMIKVQDQMRLASLVLAKRLKDNAELYPDYE